MVIFPYVVWIVTGCTIVTLLPVSGGTAPAPAGAGVANACGSNSATVGRGSGVGTAGAAATATAGAGAAPSAPAGLVIVPAATAEPPFAVGLAAFGICGAGVACDTVFF